MTEHYIRGKHAASHQGRQEIIRESYSHKPGIGDAAFGSLFIIMALVGIVAGMVKGSVLAVVVGVGWGYLGYRMIRRRGVR